MLFGSRSYLERGALCALSNLNLANLYVRVRVCVHVCVVCVSVSKNVHASACQYACTRFYVNTHMPQVDRMPQVDHTPLFTMAA